MSTEPVKPDPAKPGPVPAAGPAPAAAPVTAPAAAAAQPPASSEGAGTAIADRLSSGWQSFKAGKVISYKWMAIVLILVTAVGVGWYIWWEGRKAESAKWVALTECTTVEKLEQFENQYPGTPQARAARLDRLRVMLQRQGLAVLRPQSMQSLLDPNSPKVDDAARKAAADSIEKARDLADRSADEYKDDLPGRVECLYAGAVAEEALVGLPRADNPSEYRGSVTKLVERLNQLAEAAPEDNPWGKWARTRVEQLQKPGAAEEFVAYQRTAYLPPPDFKGAFGGGGLPPGIDPSMFRGGGIGGLPAGQP